MPEKVKITTIVAVIAFVFSALGTVIGNVYIAAKYVNKIETNEKTIIQNKIEFEKYKEEQIEKFIRKDTFDEYAKGKDGTLNQIQTDIRDIKNFILNNKSLKN